MGYPIGELVDELVLLFRIGYGDDLGMQYLDNYFQGIDISSGYEARMIVHQVEDDDSLTEIFTLDGTDLTEEGDITFAYDSSHSSLLDLESTYRWEVQVQPDGSDPRFVGDGPVEVRAGASS